MKQPRIQAALVVAASALITSTIAWTCPIEPEAVKTAPFGGALVAIEIAFAFPPSGRDASAVLSREPGSTVPPLPTDGATPPSALVHPAMFFDFDFAAARQK